MRLQDDARVAAGAANVAAWKTGNDFDSHQQPAGVPPVTHHGKTILGQLPAGFNTQDCRREKPYNHRQKLGKMGKSH